MTKGKSTFRDEVERGCRVQVREALAPLRKADEEFRNEIAELKRRVKNLEKVVTSLGGMTSRTSPINEVDVSPDELASLRPSGKMIIEIRKKLGISQETLAKIMNVTAQSVYLWERHKGPLTLRTHATHSLARVRKLSKHDALRMIHQINVLKMRK